MCVMCISIYPSPPPSNTPALVPQYRSGYAVKNRYKRLVADAKAAGRPVLSLVR